MAKCSVVKNGVMYSGLSCVSKLIGCRLHYRIAYPKRINSALTAKRCFEMKFFDIKFYRNFDFLLIMKTSCLVFFFKIP